MSNMVLKKGLYHIAFLVCAILLLAGLQDYDLLQQLISNTKREELSLLTLEQLVFFNLMLGTLVWASFYFRGVSNRATIIEFGMLIPLHNFIYYGSHKLLAELQYGLYFKIHVGVLAAFTFAFLFKKRQMFKRWCAWKLQNILPGLARAIVRTTMPTHLDFRLRRVINWYIVLEVVYFLYMLGYVIMMGIPNSGSIYVTEKDSGHIHSSFVYTVLYQVIGVVFLVEIVFAIRKDWDEPDFLISRN
ncbi:hypothetical protein GCM10009092_29560 [Bowmanella denitrificans]|uniref:Uncharacterized protein n=1 Tax=Bowmanella denitrificans TaxID=366582 RepID=A0ABN0XGK2_9ALTE